MFGWLKGTSKNDPLYVEGEGDFSFEIVGESYYQDALGSIAGPKTEDSKEVFCEAILVCEPDNPHDSNAIAVFISDKKVGHLSRIDALAYRKSMAKRFKDVPLVKVDAVIVGGWLRDDSEGSFGVKLDL